MSDKKRSRGDESKPSFAGEFDETIMFFSELEKDFATVARYREYHAALHTLARIVGTKPKWMKNMATPEEFAENFEQPLDCDDDKERIAESYEDCFDFLSELFQYFANKYWDSDKTVESTKQVAAQYKEFYDVLAVLASETYCTKFFDETFYAPAKFEKRHKPK